MNVSEFDIDALARRLGLSLHLESDSDITNLTSTVKTAGLLVSKLVGSSPVPRSVVEEAVLAEARELHTRMKSPGGIYAVYGDQTGAVRLANDPLRIVRPMLEPWLAGGFA